jgi:CheY-like chemotaxis protein
MTRYCVATSAEALTIAREKRIDVALLDLALGPDELTRTESGLRIRRLRLSERPTIESRCPGR